MSARILVADDEPDILRLVAIKLERAGYEVLTASTSDEALAVALAARPALVLLDIDMPRRNGIDVCRELRARPATAGATIVMLTAAADDGAQRRAGEAGADLFLTKPFSPLELLRLVDRLGATGS